MSHVLDESTFDLNSPSSTNGSYPPNNKHSQMVISTDVYRTSIACEELKVTDHRNLLKKKHYTKLYIIVEQRHQKLPIEIILEWKNGTRIERFALSTPGLQVDLKSVSKNRVKVSVSNIRKSVQLEIAYGGKDKTSENAIQTMKYWHSMLVRCMAYFQSVPITEYIVDPLAYLLYDLREIFNQRLEPEIVKFMSRGCLFWIKHDNEYKPIQLFYVPIISIVQKSVIHMKDEIQENTHRGFICWSDRGFPVVFHNRSLSINSILDIYIHSDTDINQKWIPRELKTNKFDRFSELTICTENNVLSVYGSEKSIALWVLGLTLLRDQRNAVYTNKLQKRASIDQSSLASYIHHSSTGQGSVTVAANKQCEPITKDSVLQSNEFTSIVKNLATENGNSDFLKIVRIAMNSIAKPINVMDAKDLTENQIVQFIQVLKTKLKEGSDFVDTTIVSNQTKQTKDPELSGENKLESDNHERHITSKSASVIRKDDAQPSTENENDLDSTQESESNNVDRSDSFLPPEFISTSMESKDLSVDVEMDKVISITKKAVNTNIENSFAKIHFARDTLSKEIISSSTMDEFSSLDFLKKTLKRVDIQDKKTFDSGSFAEELKQIHKNRPDGMVIVKKTEDMLEERRRKFQNKTDEGRTLYNNGNSNEVASLSGFSQSALSNPSSTSRRRR